jgi:dihydroxyacetone kinase-like protein
MIGYDELVRMLRCAARRIEENKEVLSRLDSHGGDGDHGTTMARAMTMLVKTVDESDSSSIKDLLQAIGWAIMGVDGGATGPLLGTFFNSLSETIESDVLDTTALATAFKAGLSGVEKHTRARVGDKTMIDALVPAVQALLEAAEQGDSPQSALESAAEAAGKGAESTKALQARFGRAKNIGEKSLGHEDPGAVSISILFQAFSEGAKTHG